MGRLLQRVLLCLLLLPQWAMAEETIKDYAVTLQVQANGNLLVTEHIRVQAEARQIKRGIYRDVPESYRERFGLVHRAPVTLISVTRDGQPEPVRTEHTGSWRRFYIGASGLALAPGEYSYELIYLVERGLLFHDGYDELYWNVTGNEWSFPIERASAEVVLPDGIVIRNQSAYTGSQGDKGEAFEVLEREDNRVLVRTTQRLSTSQGLTVALDWPSGVIARPNAGQQLRNGLLDNRGLVMGALALLVLGIFYHLTWLRVGRDPAKGLVAPLFQAPQGVFPSMAGYLWHRGFKGAFNAPKALSVWLTEMAIGKHLSISDEGKRKGFILTLGDTSSSALPDYARKMRDYLFANGIAGAQLLVGKKYEPSLEVVLNLLESYLQVHSTKWFSNNRGWWAVGFIWALASSFTMLFLSGAALDIATAAGGLLFAGMFVYFAFILFCSAWNATNLSSRIVQTVLGLLFSGPVCFGLYILFDSSSPPIALLLVGFLLWVVVYRFLLPAPSKEGREVLDGLEGYRDYLCLGESELLEMAGNAPTMSIALYEQHLPYAMALGVEKNWTARFTEALRHGLIEPSGGGYSPDWYRSSGLLSSPAALSNALSSRFISATALASSPPSRSGGGGAGGGGSSGGGRGGGGGGGW